MLPVTKTHQLLQSTREPSRGSKLIGTLVRVIGCEQDQHLVTRGIKAQSREDADMKHVLEGDSWIGLVNECRAVRREGVYDGADNTGDSQARRPHPARRPKTIFPFSPHVD